MAGKLTVEKIDRLIWLAHRRSRATGKARRGGFADMTGPLEHDLMEEMRPHLLKILKAARRALAHGRT